MEFTEQEQVRVLEEELQQCRDEREADMRLTKSLKAEIVELTRQPHYIHHSVMETTGM